MSRSPTRLSLMESLGQQLPGPSIPPSCNCCCGAAPYDSEDGQEIQRLATSSLILTQLIFHEGFLITFFDMKGQWSLRLPLASALSYLPFPRNV